MAFNRHLGRIVALQTLYEYDFRRECQDENLDLVQILHRNIERYKETIEDTAFIEQLVKGVAAHEKELDALLQPIAPEWPLEQIPRIDRNTLRLAAFELIKSNETPPKVVINEAVELAKAFGGENASKFINGVLGTLYRLHVESDTKKESKKAASKPKTKAKS